MFSKACEYGIRAVIFIGANCKEGKKTGIKDICAAIGAPEHFTAKTLQELSKRNIISSAKGPNGGFYIETGKEIKLIDIVRSIDGEKIFTNCGLGIKSCSSKKPCPIHYEFKKIRDSLTLMLETTSINQVTENFDKGLVFLKK